MPSYVAAPCPAKRWPSALFALGIGVAANAGAAISCSEHGCQGYSVDRTLVFSSPSGDASSSGPCGAPICTEMPGNPNVRPCTQWNLKMDGPIGSSCAVSVTLPDGRVSTKTATLGALCGDVPHAPDMFGFSPNDFPTDGGTDEN